METYRHATHRLQRQFPLHPPSWVPPLSSAAHLRSCRLPAQNMPCIWCRLRRRWRRAGWPAGAELQLQSRSGSWRTMKVQTSTGASPRGVRRSDGAVVLGFSRSQRRWELPVRPGCFRRGRGAADARGRGKACRCRWTYFDDRLACQFRVKSKIFNKFSELTC